jgi:DNA replication protein DnaC
MPCPHCDDTGWRPVEADGVRRVERCECWRSSMADRLVANAKIERRYLPCTLENFVVYEGNEGLRRAHKEARRFVEKYPAVEKGLFLIGSHGIGKTHLAVAILKAVIEKAHVRGLFYDTTVLFREIRSTYDVSVQREEFSILRPVLDAELLVLDDVGKDRFSDWVEETLNLIVTTRYNDRKVTIFTSNFEDNPDDREPMSLIRRVGSRVHSRLHEMCEFVEFGGADYRHLPPNGGAEDLAMLWREKRASKPLHALPARSTSRAKAELKPTRELGWSGGKAGS